MRKASDSQVLRLRKERDQLRRANHTLTIERQGYALRAQVFELEHREWTTRIDKLMALVQCGGCRERLSGVLKHTHVFNQLLYKESDGSRFRCVCGAQLWEPKSTAAVSRETEGSKL